MSRGTGDLSITHVPRKVGHPVSATFAPVHQKGQLNSPFRAMPEVSLALVCSNWPTLHPLILRWPKEFTLSYAGGKDHPKLVEPLMVSWSNHYADFRS